MSKLIDLGMVSEETKGDFFHSVDDDGQKAKCAAPSTLFYRKSTVGDAVFNATNHCKYNT